MWYLLYLIVLYFFQAANQYIFWFVGFSTVNACILFILLEKGGKDRDRIAAVKALFATLHKKINKEIKNARKKSNIALIYYVKKKIYIQTTTTKSHSRIKKRNLFCPVFWIWPRVLIHITPDIFSGKAFWEESFGMPYPYCSAAISWHAASMASWRDMVKNLPFRGMPHCCMWSHILTSSLVSHLSPFSGTSLWYRSSKISRLWRSALFHTRSDQRGHIFLYIIWSCDWKNLNTWVCFLYGNQL